MDGCVESSQACRLDGIVLLKIRPGADLLRGIEEGVERHGIRAGVFLSGLGALQRAVVRNLRAFPRQYPVTPADRLYFEVEKPLELLGVSGWIGERSEGGPEIHAHFTASYVDGERVVGVGGHLMTGTIAAIKVVIAIGVLPPGSVGAGFDDVSQSLDICLK